MQVRCPRSVALHCARLVAALVAIVALVAMTLGAQPVQAQARAHGGPTDRAQAVAAPAPDPAGELSLALPPASAEDAALLPDPARQHAIACTREPQFSVQTFMAANGRMQVNVNPAPGNEIRTITFGLPRPSQNAIVDVGNLRDITTQTTYTNPAPTQGVAFNLRPAARGAQRSRPTSTSRISAAPGRSSPAAAPTSDSAELFAGRWSTAATISRSPVPWCA